MNGYFQGINRNKYLTLVPTNESKEIINLIDLTNSTTNNLDDYDEKYMKIKFHLDDELPQNKKIKIHSMIIVVRDVFH